MLSHETDKRCRALNECSMQIKASIIPNSSANLPQIDSSTTEKWAATFAKRVIAYYEMRIKFGKVLLKEGQVDTCSRGEYDVANFLADTFFGEFPWDEKTSNVFDQLTVKIEGYEHALRELERIGIQRTM